MGLRDTILSLSPTWLSNDRGTGGKFMYNFGLAMDSELDKISQAMVARMPLKADSSALPLIGNDRLMPLGLGLHGAGELPASYALRLQHSFEDWQKAGNAWSILKQVLAYIYPGSGTGPSSTAAAFSSRQCLIPNTVVQYLNVDTIWDAYFDDQDVASGFYLDASSTNTELPPFHTLAVDTLHAFPLINWDTFSRTTTGFQFDATSGVYINHWRWQLVLWNNFTIFGEKIDSATNTTPVEITTKVPHNLTTGDTVSIDGVTGSALSLTGAANSAGEIEITTSTNHGLVDGNLVFISGANGTVPVGGQWVVTVTSANTFLLNGSVFSGAGTTTGIVYCIFSANGGAVWTITTTGPSSFTLDGSTASGPTDTGPAVQLQRGQAFTKASNNWVDEAPFVFGTPGVKIGQRPDASIGLNLSPQVVGQIRSTVDLWKSAESWCQWMIVSFDPALFTPQVNAVWQGPRSWEPDGYFGRWSRVVNNQYVPARFSNARYCDGVA